MGVRIFLIYFLSSSMLFTYPIATAQALPPIFSPITDRICDSIECGKGTCKPAPNRTLSFVWECDAGWNQFHVEDNFRFMPCVIPNCSVNYSCNNASAPAAAPRANDSSISDPCTWAYCGEGRCMKTSGFGHKCQCADGHANLLNLTIFPCFTECALGTDCLNRGFGLTNRSSSTSSGLPNSFGAFNKACLNFSGNFLWSIFFVIFSLLQHA